MLTIKRYKVYLIAGLALIIAIASILFAACGGGGSTSANIDKLLEDGIIEETDLSFSPLGELAFPSIDLQIPVIELPDISMDVNLDFSQMMP